MEIEHKHTHGQHCMAEKVIHTHRACCRIMYLTIYNILYIAAYLLYYIHSYQVCFVTYYFIIIISIKIIELTLALIKDFLKSFIGQIFIYTFDFFFFYYYFSFSPFHYFFLFSMHHLFYFFWNILELNERDWWSHTTFHHTNTAHTHKKANQMYFFLMPLFSFDAESFAFC